jgi:hypothetical protein
MAMARSRREIGEVQKEKTSLSAIVDTSPRNNDVKDRRERRVKQNRTKGPNQARTGQAIEWHVPRITRTTFVHSQVSFPPLQRLV